MHSDVDSDIAWEWPKGCSLWQEDMVVQVLEHLGLNDHKDFPPEQTCGDYCELVEVGQFEVGMD